MEAITREEKIMSGENLTPITREEMFLAKAAGMDVEVPQPITRKEIFLSNIGGSGGGGTPHEPNIQPLTVTKNGTYTASDGVDGYSPVSVEVASAGGTDERFKQLVEKTITEISDDTVTSVGNYAFYYHTQLTSVNLPLATSIGAYAFSSCSQLTSIDLPLATSIGAYAFSSCSQLTSVKLPLATSVGNNAFQHCAQLTSINLPLVTSVDNTAFYGCSKLMSVNLPSVTSVDYNVFYGCSQLTSINLPLVTSVGNSAFSSCSQLTSINLPLVTSVGNSAFGRCSRLTCVIFRAETVCALSHTNAFDSTPFASGKAGGTLFVPRALVEEYKVATNWSVIWGYGHNRFLALEDYTVDGTITGEIDWEKLNGGAA